MKKILKVFLLFGLFFGLFFSLVSMSFASFSLAGTTLIQVGTDDSASFIAAMQAEPAVDVMVYGSPTTHSTFYVIDFNNITLRITGTLEVDNMHRQTWIFSGTDTTSRLHVTSTGNFILHAPQERLGYNYNPENGLILFAFENNSTSWNHQTFQTDNGAIVLFDGITMRGEFSSWIRGNTTLQNCIIERVGNDGDIQFNISNGDQTVLRNVKFYVDGQSGITFRDGKPTIDNVQVFGARDAFNNEGNGTVDGLIIEGLDSDTGSTADLAQFGQNRRNVILNAKYGSKFVWADHLNGGNPAVKDAGMVEVLQTVRSSVTNENGSAVANAKRFIKDDPQLAISAGTVHVLSTFDTQAANVQRNSIHTSDATGVIAPFNVLVAEGKSGGGDPFNGDIRGRGKNPIAYDYNTSSPDDLFEYGFISYNNNISVGDVTLAGIGGTDLDAVLPTDTSITETNKTTVGAYTTLDTAQQFYDRAKAYLYDNYAGEASVLVTRAGDTIDAGNYDVVVDATAASVFAFDGNTITIKATNFAGNITTSGTVSFLNGASYVGVVGDSSGTTSLLSLTGLPADSYVYVMNDSGLTFDYESGQVGTYTTNIPSSASGTWTYVVKKPGYIAQVSSFTPTGGEYSFPVNLTVQYQSNGSVMYNASVQSLIDIEFDSITELDIDVGDGTVTNQEVYDMVEKALVTEDGMLWLANGRSGVTISNLSSGSYIFLTDGVRFRRNTSGDVNATVSSFAVSTEGVIINNVNGGIQFLTSGANDVTISSADKDVIAALVKTNVEADGGLMDQIYDLLQDILTWLQSIKGDTQKIK